MSNLASVLSAGSLWPEAAAVAHEIGDRPATADGCMAADDDDVEDRDAELAGRGSTVIRLPVLLMSELLR